MEKTLDKRGELIKLAKFLLLCGVVAGVESGSYALLLHLHWLEEVAAHAVSYILGSVVCYALNRKFTFHAKGGFFSAALFKYAVVSGASLLLGVGIMWLLVHVFSLTGSVIAEVCAKAIVMLLTTASNYLGQRLWAFD